MNLTRFIPKQTTPATSTPAIPTAPPVRRIGVAQKITQLTGIGLWRLLTATIVLDAPSRVRGGDPLAFRRTRAISAWIWGLIIPTAVFALAGPIAAAPLFVAGFFVLARHQAAASAIDLSIAEFPGLIIRLVKENPAWRTAATVGTALAVVALATSFVITAVAELAFLAAWGLGLVIASAAILNPVSGAAGEGLGGPISRAVEAAAASANRALTAGVGRIRIGRKGAPKSPTLPVESGSR